MTETKLLESVVTATLDKYCAISDRLAVGVSGGEDSMCLLSLLAEVRDRSRLIAVHVQHGIRGNEALEDARFVEEFCLKNGIAFLRFDKNVPEFAAKNKISVESAARICRRRIFRAVIDEGKADYIVLAHHAADQTESVLMHVLRGAGTGGMAGMREKEGFVLRPLLGVDKALISRYVAAKHIAFREDSTNGDTAYRRNFLRHEVIPLIKRHYDVDSAASRLSQLCRADDEFIYSQLKDEDFRCGEESCSFPSEMLHRPYAVASRYVLRAAERAGLSEDVEKKHVDAVLALSEKANGSEIDLPHGFCAAKEYGEITVYRRRQRLYDEIAFAEGITPFADGYISITPAEKRFKKGSPVFDGDKIPPEAVVRFRREGDTFAPYKSGKKKLKEYFIDEKVPRRLRNEIPLICAGDRVLCVCGMEIADEIKTDDHTVNCLKFIYGKE